MKQRSQGVTHRRLRPVSPTDGGVRGGADSQSRPRALSSATWTPSSAASFRLGAGRHLQLCCYCGAEWEVTGVKQEERQEGPLLTGRVPAVDGKDDLWTGAATEEKGTATSALLDGRRARNRARQSEDTFDGVMGSIVTPGNIEHWRQQSASRA